MCEQLPAAGAPVTSKPRLTVERSCAAATPGTSTSQPPSATPTESAPTPTASPTITGKVTDTTVDRLVDTNANKVKNGELYRVTGKLVGSEYWTTGASGDFSVLLETEQGADLMVLIDERETLDWEDGMKVDMLLEVVPLTIDSETTDGWMRARSARIVS